MPKFYFISTERLIKGGCMLLWFLPHVLIISQIWSLSHAHTLQILKSFWIKLDAVVILCFLMAIINFYVLVLTTRRLRFAITMSLLMALFYFLICVFLWFVMV